MIDVQAAKKSKRYSMKHALFVQEYLKDFNATQAAVRCGYSEKTANFYGPRLYRKLSSVIDQRKAKVMEKSEMSLEKWVETVSALAMYDPRKLFDVHGNPTEIPELSRLAAMTVAGFEIEELYDGRGEDRQKIGYVRKYKLLDRTPYLQMLGKHLNAFPVSKTPAAPPKPSQYDSSKLTDAEWEEYKRIRRKALVVNE